MRFLHLEGNPKDVAAVREHLEREWKDCDVVAVSTPADFRRQLDAGGYDVILADSGMNGFEELGALQLNQEPLPEVPFILLAGANGENGAIAAVRGDAHDYVLKDRIGQLVPAIRRLLRNREESDRRLLAEKSQERFIAILENTPDLVSLAAVNGNLFYLNRAGRHMLRLREGEDIGLCSLQDFHPPEVFAHLRQEVIPAAERDGAWSGELVMLARDGTRIPVSTVLIAHKAPDGRTEYFSLVVRDISPAKEAERRIREQAELLDKTRDAIVVTDAAGVITFWSRGAERAYGWTAAEAVGHPHQEFLGNHDGGSRNPTGAGESDWRGDLRVRNKAGKLLIMDRRVTRIRDHSGRPAGQLTISTDITERKTLEQQFLRAQRLESIGMLAAGIAHDLNNVLAPILMAAPMLRERVTNPVDLKMIAAMEKSAERGAGLVRQILGFAHGAGGEHRLLQVKHLIRDIVSVINETFPRKIRFESVCPTNLWAINANATQIHQVLLNLCVNARDAMPSGGNLRLESENCVLDETAAAEIEGGRPGTFVRIRISDTGTGIPSEVLAHIWEPFFTTKAADKGTGLGLSTVRGIVQNHNGFITVSTRDGRGTTFSVYLPSEGGSESTDPGLSLDELPRGQGELVLVVDDEPNVRDLATTILMRHGYRVLVSEGGTEGLALFVPRASEINLVLTDLNMPGLDGAAFAAIILKLSPGTRVLIMSGMSRLSPARKAPDLPGTAFLGKPFAVPALLKAVNALLHPEAEVPSGAKG